MAGMNSIDASPAAIQRQWHDIRAQLGPVPDRSEPMTPTQSAGSVAVQGLTGKAIAGTLFFWFRRKLPHWQVTKQECDDIGHAWGGVIDWMFPGEGLRGFMRWIDEKLKAYRPLVDALKVTGKVAGDRIFHPDQYALPEPAKKAPASPGDDQAQPAKKKPAPAAGSGQMSALRDGGE